jgi:hypothetical protein
MMRDTNRSNEKEAATQREWSKKREVRERKRK